MSLSKFQLQFLDLTGLEHKKIEFPLVWKQIHMHLAHSLKYKPIEKLPFIPAEQEIDSLISGCNTQMSTFLQLLKETGARRCEAFNLTWTEIDFVTNTVRIIPEKGSKPRIFKMSERLTRMISELPKKSGRIWLYKNSFYLSRGFRRMHKKNCAAAW